MEKYNWLAAMPYNCQAEYLMTLFLFDSRYSKRLSHNFRTVLRGIGSTVAGDEKLLHFTGMTAYLSYCS